MSLLIDFFIQLLKALLPAAIQSVKDNSPDTTEEAKPDLQVKTAMENKIRAALKVSASSLLIMMLAGGCFTNTVYVEAGTPVKLRQSIPACRVWIPVRGKLTAGVVTIPEGWWACNLSSTDLK